MTSPPGDRCGYTWPQDHEPADRPRRQNCCWRETTEGTDRCIWHADPDTVSKSVERLQAARAPLKVREQNSGVAELLDGAKLSGVDVGDSLSFERVSLRDAKLGSANLHKADLSEVNLRYADLSEAFLWYVDLTEADLREANLTEADLPNADMTEAYLYEADLTEANLCVTDLTGADLYEANLTEAFLNYANLTDADLFNVNLTETDLSHADLIRGYLLGADLTKTNLGHADLTEANLRFADLIETDMREAGLTEADLGEADLTEADLRWTTITETKMQEAVFSNADLRDATCKACVPRATDETDTTTASLEDAQFEDGTDLRGADLSGARLYQTAFRDVRINDDTRFGVDGDDKPGTACRYEYDPNATVAIDDGDTDRLRAAAWTYRRLESLFEANAMDERARNAHIRKEEAQRAHRTEKVREQEVEWEWNWLRDGGSFPTAWTKSLGEAVLGWVNWQLHRHGESLRRLLWLSGLLIVLCSFVYSVAGITQSSTGTTYQLGLADLTSPAAILTDLVNGLYFSVITFSTIGYGDFYPASDLSRVFVAIESLAGALFIALFVFVYVFTPRTQQRAQPELVKSSRCFERFA